MVAFRVEEGLEYRGGRQGRFYLYLKFFTRKMSSCITGVINVK